MHIGHIESTPQIMVELRDSTHSVYWTRTMKSELEGLAAIGTFSDKNIPQEVNAVSTK